MKFSENWLRELVFVPADRAELTADPKPWSRRVLEHFDTDSSRLSAFREFFHLPDFWQWDAEFNSQSFKPTP